MNKSKTNHVFIIAEAGVNHNGNIAKARRLIDAARAAGADAVKFQTFRAEHIVCERTPKAAYQKKTSGARETQLAMLKRLELSESAHRELIRHCEKRGILFLSTPFDLESIELVARLKVSLIKIPSGEITNIPYLRKVASVRKKIILSTGMATLPEIGDAIAVLVQGGVHKRDITVLHCNTQYPTPFEDVHLKAMTTIRSRLGVNVGYSDHTPGIEVALAAVALGASVIEKHFTLDRTLKGPDHAASLEPDELTAMVIAIRNIGKAIGLAVKKCSPSESANRKIIRKSIVAACPIKKGAIFTQENITTKRPGTGISPMQWDRVLGRRAIKDFKPDETIRL